VVVEEVQESAVVVCRGRESQEGGGVGGMIKGLSQPCGSACGFRAGCQGLSGAMARSGTMVLRRE
jgi:hypothetical protein